MNEFELTVERKILYSVNEDENISITWLSDTTYSNYEDIKCGDIIYIDDSVEVSPICIDILNHKNVYCYGMFDSQSNEDVLYRIGFENIEDYFKILATEFSTYAFLFIRHYNKHSKKPIDIFDFEKVIFEDKSQITIAEAIEHLEKKVSFKESLFLNPTILNSIRKFTEHARNCSVEHMRISRFNRKGFTEIENMFNDEFFRGIYYNRFCLRHADVVAKKINLSVEFINEMCLTGKLLNTEQAPDGWYVEAREVYLHIKKNNESDLGQTYMKQDSNDFLNMHTDLIDESKQIINNVIPLKRKVN